MRGLTHAEIIDLLRLQLPEPTNGCKFRFDRAKILAALATLEIELPVVVTLRTYKTHQTGWLSYGKHYARREPTPHHEIRLNSKLLPHHANQIFWHELAHAMQAERFARRCNSPSITIADFYIRAYPHAKGPHGANYMQNAYELEAEEIAATFAPTIEGRLVVPNEA